MTNLKNQPRYKTVGFKANEYEKNLINKSLTAKQMRLLILHCIEHKPDLIKEIQRQDIDNQIKNLQQQRKKIN